MTTRHPTSPRDTPDLTPRASPRQIIDKAVDAGALRRGVTSQRSAGVRAHRRWAKLRAPILLRPFSRGARRSLAELTGGERSSAAAPREGDTTALVAVVPDGTMAGV